MHKIEQKSGNKSHSSLLIRGIKLSNNIETKVEKLIKEPINKKGYEIYDIEYVKEGKDYYLRIFIEKPEKSIDIGDCAIVNDIVNPILDDANIIKEQYYLEVSSTGIEKNLRKLNHYKKSLGKEIFVKLFKKDESGNKEIEGILKKVQEKEITIEKDGKTFNINLNDISNAKTIYH